MVAEADKENSTMLGIKRSLQMVVWEGELQ